MAKKIAKKSTPMTKAQLISELVDSSEGLTRKQVQGLLETLTNIGHKQLKKAGQFTVPGFAKFSVVTRAATKARKGVNPRTGEAITIKAKPRHKVVRARPVKAIKDTVS